MTIQEIFASGATVKVDLLLAVPDSTDPATWLRPPWPGYAAADGQVSPVSSESPGGTTFSIGAQFLSTGGNWPIAAVGITYEGGCIAIGLMLAAPLCIENVPYPVVIDGQAQPVLT